MININKPLQVKLLSLCQVKPLTLCYFSGRTNRTQWWAQKSIMIVPSVICFNHFEYLVTPRHGYYAGRVTDEKIFWAGVLIYFMVVNIALGYRRLVDAGYSTWLLLFMLFPYAGSIILGFIECFAPSIGDDK
jgi:uncharacterized membrane protein YhaH (DUF805 family)